jgi:hypothetical protein
MAKNGMAKNGNGGGPLAKDRQWAKDDDGNGQRTAMGGNGQRTTTAMGTAANKAAISVKIDCKERQIIRRQEGATTNMATTARQAWQHQQQRSTIPFHLFLYQKQLPDDRSNTAITNNIMQTIEEARSKEEEEAATAMARQAWQRRQGNRSNNNTFFTCFFIKNHYLKTVQTQQLQTIQCKQ